MSQLYKAIWKLSGGRQVMLILLAIAIAALAAVPLELQKRIVNMLTAKDIGDSSLIWHCLLMLGAIMLSLILKWLLGYLSGILGEDIIRLLRNRLLNGAVTYKNDGKDIRTGTLTTAISAEAEELGKFAGSALSEPAVQIGTLFSVSLGILPTPNLI